MAIPDFQTIMRPFLINLHDGQTKHISKIANGLAHYFRLTPEELREKVPSGQQYIFNNRVSWTASHFKKAGLIQSESTGNYSITELGKNIADDKNIKLNLAYLKTLPKYQEWQKTFGNKQKTNDNKERKNTDQENLETPEYIIGKTLERINSELKYELLEIIKAKDAAFFETFVLELLNKMGYGTEDNSFEVIGQSGDMGIDGIIYQDKLGLEKIYVQAKRWKETKVASKDIRDFIGALNLKGSTKGVFMTTSFFTPDAVHTANTNPHNNVVLIDGNKLTDLAIEHNIGVQIKDKILIKQIDKDFFE